MGDLHVWHDGPLREGVRASAQRLADSEGVRRVALMPDAHLAEDVCIGVVVATTDKLYPSAVGGDIGCGMAAVAFDVEAARVAEPATAAQILAGLYAGVPFVRHRRGEGRDSSACTGRPCPLPARHPEGREGALGVGQRRGLSGRVSSECRAQLGTLGSGNHFIELQADEEGRLWLMK